MAASYPAAVKTFTTKTNSVDTVNAEDVNALQDEVTAMQTEAVSSGFTNTIKALAGVQFPATQAVSADANRLDDYEEGTWTPTLLFGGASTGITYTTQSGHYAKVGKNVFFKGILVLSNDGSATGAASIAGLPFAEGDNVNGAIAIGTTANFTGLTGAIVGIVNNNAATITLHQTAATGSAAITEAVFTNTATIHFSGWYRATA